ncbi:MAG: response regulator [Clostridia bacterium]|nr:response regulator [Clostridia bacterium]
MYKLMIVDDEQSIRRGIANGIPWNEWGFEVTAQASNGVEALEMIKQSKPDVVLSDIRMPEMDGVELMKRLNSEYPEIKIIILSGYSDFEYLNTAIKNNITEYLLKPTDIDEFEETFKRLKTKMDDEQAHMDEFERGKIYALDSILNMLLLGYMDEEIMEPDRKLIEDFGVRTDNCVIAILCIEWKEYMRDEGVMHKKRMQIAERCNSYAKQLESNCYFFIAQSKNIAAVMSGKDGVLMSDAIIKDFKYIADMVSGETGEKIYIGVSRLCVNRLMIPQSYEQALCVAHQKKFGEGGEVIIYREIKGSSDEIQSVSFDYKAIDENIIKNDRDMLYKEIERVFACLEENQLNYYQYIEQICLELMFYLSRWSLRYNINFEQIMDLSGVHYNDIRKTVSIERRKKLIITVMDGLCDCVEQFMQHSGKNNNLARVIKECVDKEYMENFMSLDYVAGKVKKSATYVSKLFKDEFGCNFSEYITRKRLETSKELLADPSNKIYEIAQMSGYADVSNFIKVFKKMYGISPGDYRNFIQR